jgi:hypothetical protein
MKDFADSINQVSSSTPLLRSFRNSVLTLSTLIVTVIGLKERKS